MATIIETSINMASGRSVRVHAANADVNCYGIASNKLDGIASNKLDGVLAWHKLVAHASEFRADPFFVVNTLDGFELINAHLIETITFNVCECSSEEEF